MRKTAAVFISLLVFTCGCATSRQAGSSSRSEDLQNRIEALERELENKEDQISLLERRLEEAGVEGMSESKEEVQQAPLSAKKIQTALKNAGYYNGAIDGKIGKASRQAIIDFQKAQGLKADGIVGKKTQARLRSYLE